MKKPIKNQILGSLIKSLNMTQGTFAALLGVPLSRVRNWLNGTRPLRPGDESLIQQVTGFRGSLCQDATSTLMTPSPHVGTPIASAKQNEEESKLWHASATEYRIERMCLFVRICLMEAAYSDSNWARLRAKAVEKLLEQRIRDIERRFDLLQFRTHVLESPAVREKEALMEEKHANAWKEYLSKKKLLFPSSTRPPAARAS